MSRPTPKRMMGLCLLVATVGAGALYGPSFGGSVAATEVPPATTVADGRPTEEVRRGDLTESRDATGTVGFGDSWAAPIEIEGVVTKRHNKGTVVDFGQPLIWIGTRPVLLAEGDVPMYRELRHGRDADRKLQSGDDVEQLQAFLLAGGFDDDDRLTADGEFGPSTERAVKAWQEANGLEKTGAIDRSQLVFHPSALRIDDAPRVGDRFNELRVTEGHQSITAQFEQKAKSFVPVGASLELEVGDNERSTGVVQTAESKINESGTSVIEVTIDPDGALASDTTRTKVIASKTVAADALLVPARSILALSGSGYALEVRTAGGSELRRVELGAFIDDLVEVTGDVAEGDEVVVPDDGIGGDS